MRACAPEFSQSRFRSARFTINCLYFNARSIVNKLHELHSTLQSGEFDVVCLSETWLTSSVTDAMLATPGYIVVRCDRVGRVGGGVAILCKEELQVAPVSVDAKFATCEVCALDFVVSNCQKRLICAYRPPSTSDDATDLFVECLQSLVTGYVSGPVCLVGDFNLPSVDWQGLRFPDIHVYASFMQDVVFFHGFRQLICEPTRGDACLDLLLVNDPLLMSSHRVYVPFADTCDHNSIVFSLNHVPAASQPRYRRVWRKADWEGARSFLASLDWSDVFANCPDIDAYYSALLSLLQRVIETYVPLVKCRPGKARLPVYLQRLFRRKRQAFVPAHCSTPTTRAHYRKMTSLCKRKLAAFHRRREDSVLSGGNIRSFYQYVNNQRVVKSRVAPLKRFDGTLATDPVDQAFVLSNYFSSVFTRDNGVCPEFPRRCSASISEVTFPPFAVYNKLRVLKRTTSAGPDSVPNILLRELAVVLAAPLASLFELSFVSGNVPTLWRSADVVPIFKKGNTREGSNYRPVSLTCTMCRVMESVIKSQVLSFLYLHRLISVSQHGFLSRKSTCTQLLACFDDWSRSVRDNTGMYVVYVDFAKAFDTVSLPKLLHKLHSYGMSESLLNWVSSFLSNRQQRVKVSGVYSSYSPVSSGVPQGSVLGPLFFLLFINDIVDVVPRAVKIKLFADDVKLYCPVAYAADLQIALDTLCCWSDEWQLRVSVPKCFVLPIGPVAQADTTLFRIGSKVLEKVSHCVDLGVTVTSSLSTSRHCSKIVGKASKAVAVLSRCFRTRNVVAHVRAFVSYVRPVLEYCSPVWNPYLVRDIKALEKVQRSFTRRVYAKCRLPPDDDYDTRLSRLGLKRLESRRRIADLVMCFQIRRGFSQVDPSLLNWSARCTDRLVNTDNPRVNVRRYFFKHRVVGDWNRFSSVLSNCTSVSQFRRATDKRIV